MKMRMYFLLLAILVLPSYKSFSQTNTETVEPVPYQDSLVCFPQRYLEFMVGDLKQGKKDRVKVDELNQSFKKKEEEFRQMKSNLNAELELTASLQDSLEGKNSLIMHLHEKNHKAKTKTTIWKGVAILATFLFVLK